MMGRTRLLPIFNFFSCQGILERRVRSIFDSESVVAEGFLKQSVGKGNKYTLHRHVISVPLESGLTNKLAKLEGTCKNTEW